MTLVRHLMMMAQERLHLEVARAVVQVQVQEACSAEPHCSLCATLDSWFNSSLVYLTLAPTTALDTWTATSVTFTLGTAAADDDAASERSPDATHFGGAVLAVLLNPAAEENP